MGKRIRRIINRDFLSSNTLEYARSCEPAPTYRKNRHDTQNCSIIHYNSVVLNRNILQRFRELSPTAASYHWKIMPLRDLRIHRYHSVKELELDAIEHTCFNRQQNDIKAEMQRICQAIQSIDPEIYFRFIEEPTLPTVAATQR